MSGSARFPEEGERRLTCSPAAMAAEDPAPRGSAEPQLPRASGGELQASQAPDEQSSALFILLVNPRRVRARVNLWLWLNKVTQFRACSPGLFNDNVRLFEFSCVAAQGQKNQNKTHNPKRKAWDTKQMHTPWFAEVGSRGTAGGFRQPRRK